VVPVVYARSIRPSAGFGKDKIVRIGLVGLTGEATVPIDVTLKLPRAPKRVLVNANGEVLARD